MITYLCRGHKWLSRIVIHIEAKDRLGLGRNTAICGVRMKFNQSTPFALGRPVCKNCLRSCIDVRIAA